MAQVYASAPLHILSSLLQLWLFCCFSVASDTSRLPGTRGPPGACCISGAYLFGLQYTCLTRSRHVRRFAHAQLVFFHLTCTRHPSVVSSASLPMSDIIAPHEVVTLDAAYAGGSPGRCFLRHTWCTGDRLGTSL